MIPKMFSMMEQKTILFTEETEHKSKSKGS